MKLKSRKNAIEYLLRFQEIARNSISKSFKRKTKSYTRKLSEPGSKMKNLKEKFKMLL